MAGHGRPGSQPGDAVGRCLGEALGHADDLRLRQERDPFRPLGGAVLDLQVPPLHQTVGVLLLEAGLVHRLARREAVLPVGEIPHELLVPEPLRQDDVGHRRGQRPVLARAHRQPLVRLGAHRAEARVHHRHRSLVQHLPEPADGIGHHAVGRHRIRAPDEEVLRLLQVVVVVAPEALGVVVPELLGLGAEGAVGDVVGRAEDLRHRVVEEVVQVGAPQRTAQHRVHVRCGQAQGRRLAVIDQHAELRRVVQIGRAHIEQLARDRIERFLPRNGDEARILGAALRGVRPFHRHLDPIRVVHLLQDEMPPGTHRPVVRLGQLVPAHLDGPAVLHEDLDGAPGGAALAGRRHPLPGRDPGRAGLVVGSVGEGIEQGPAERRRRPSRHRDLQEIPPLDPHVLPPVELGTESATPREAPAAQQDAAGRLTHRDAPARNTARSLPTAIRRERLQKTVRWRSSARSRAVTEG